MKHKVNQVPDDLKAEIYNQYCQGESIAELAKRFSLSKANVKNVITKCMCGGAGLTVRSRQQEFPLKGMSG